MFQTTNQINMNKQRIRRLIILKLQSLEMVARHHFWLAVGTPCSKQLPILYICWIYLEIGHLRIS